MEQHQAHLQEGGIGRGHHVDAVGDTSLLACPTPLLTCYALHTSGVIKEDTIDISGDDDIEVLNVSFYATLISSMILSTWARYKRNLAPFLLITDCSASIFDSWKLDTWHEQHMLGSWLDPKTDVHYRPPQHRGPRHEHSLR